MPRSAPARCWCRPTTGSPSPRPSSSTTTARWPPPAGGTPIVLYNVPTRVGINLDPPLVIQLARDRVHRGRQGLVGQPRGPPAHRRCHLRHRRLPPVHRQRALDRRRPARRLRRGRARPGQHLRRPPRRPPRPRRERRLEGGVGHPGRDRRLRPDLRGAARHQQLLGGRHRRAQGSAGAARNHRPRDDVAAVRHHPTPGSATTWPPCSPTWRAAP